MAGDGEPEAIYTPQPLRIRYGLFGPYGGVRENFDPERPELPELHPGRLGNYVGMPAAIKLDQFGSEIIDAFGHPPYLVGSATRTKRWRDVDVRLILPDDEYDALFGARRQPAALDVKWNAYCLAFSARAREVTGLPVDFQIDRCTEANAQHAGPRMALGIAYLLETGA